MVETVLPKDEEMGARLLDMRTDDTIVTAGEQMLCCNKELGDTIMDKI